MYDTRRAAASINFYNMSYGEVIDIFENLEFKSLSDYVRLAESYMSFCKWKKFQNTVRLIISHLEILVCVHEDFRFEIMYWKYKSATGYAQQKSIAKAKEAFEDILKILPDDYYRHLNHKIYMHAGIFYGKQMNMDKAEKFFNMSWELSKKFYQNHPLRSEKRVISVRKDFEAEFCHNKGAVLADAYQCEKAEELLLQSLEIKLELLGKDSIHPDIGLRYHALGNVYLGLMLLQKAIEYQEKAMEHFKSSPHNNLVR